jgi:hypothetical protein
MTSFRSATIFIALKADPWLNSIFQRWEEPQHNFFCGPFSFSLRATDGIDVCRYLVTYEDFSIKLTFVGVDCTALCGRQSNVDFVYFMWQNLDIPCFQRHALTFQPISLFAHGRLLCIRHYRAMSMGWIFTSGCGTCADNR